MQKKMLCFLLGMFFFSAAVHAHIVLPSVFSDNMVLQQKSKVKIWGKTEPGKTVTVSNTWDKRNYTVTAAATGSWIVSIATPVYGGPYELVISDGEPVTLKNILIGDVWVCSGQSNMEMPLAGWGKVLDYEQEIKAADYPGIRLLQARQTASTRPLNDLVLANGGWQVCSPQSIPDFSSTAYFFAREIHKKTGIPIGLVHTSWGGTYIEAWTGGEALKKLPAYADGVEKIEKAEPAVDHTDGNRPSVLFNAMIHPILSFGIKGVIWYQGEANADRGPADYYTLFPTMINNWRQRWGYDFPFYFVQLANFMKKEPQPGPADWAVIRDAQRQALSLPNTGMAVTTDIGDENDIHPKNKQEVGRRLALIALSEIYNRKLVYSGPVLKSKSVNGDQVVLRFSSADGLRAKGGQSPTGFAVAGADRQFYWAVAKIEGTKVILHSDKVANPVAVRYGWANNPDANLMNAAGLPASPFRTDTWELK